MFAGVKAKKSGAQNRQIKKKKDDDCKKGSQTLASCIDKLKKKRDEGESVVNEHPESQIDEVEPLDDNGLLVELYSQTVSIGSNLVTVTFLLGPEFNIQVTNHCMLESPIGSPDTPGASDSFVIHSGVQDFSNLGNVNGRPSHTLISTFNTNVTLLSGQESGTVANNNGDNEELDHSLNSSTDVLGVISNLNQNQLPNGNISVILFLVL